MKSIYRILLVIALYFSLSTNNSKAQWSAPVSLSPNGDTTSLNESMGSCLGVSGDSVHVVWTDKMNSHHAILYYSRSLDTGFNWSPPIAISSPTGNAWNAAIAVNGRNIHVAWREIDTVTNKRASWYNHSLDGGATWGAPMFLDSTADWPAISVSGNRVYIANDRVVSQSPYNTEIFFMYSLDNGSIWSNPQQLTNAVGRSEDEAITAEGSHLHMSWNDNRTGQFQIFYKHSTDYGITWGPDLVVDTPYEYNTMVSANGPYIDVVACGAPTGHYQLLLSQSADSGATWNVMNRDLSNDTAHTYFLPHMTRDGCDLHVICSSNNGAKYFHSGDGGITWDAPFGMAGTSFIAYTGHVLHVIYVDASHSIKYLRNPIGNPGIPCTVTGTNSLNYIEEEISLYPNPATNLITISIADNNITSCTLNLYNILGEKAFDQMIIDKANTSIDISKLPQGIYFAEVNINGTKVLKKVVKLN